MNFKFLMILAMLGFLASSLRAEEVAAEFATPEEASKALQEAAKTVNKEAILKLFGAMAREIANPDTVEAANDWAELAKHFAVFSNVVKEGDTATIYIGAQNWPFPVPIRKKGEKWFFDGAAGKEEILNRRIGENELNIIEVCREYVEAQRKYSLSDPNGNDVVEYAQKIMSSPKKKDGLYWEATAEEVQSPFGLLAAKAFKEGYGKKVEKETPDGNPFHGYYFHILTKQGKNAPGGEFNYIINNHMVAGFGLVAYPAEWGNSGVMTFIVNQRGKVFQKDLGEKTKELAAKMEEFNPDETWTAVKDE